VVAMQLAMQAAVGPGDPHLREHRYEFAESAPCQVPGCSSSRRPASPVERLLRRSWRKAG
jgi:hypothetical protein